MCRQSYTGRRATRHMTHAIALVHGPTGLASKHLRGDFVVVLEFPLQAFEPVRRGENFIFGAVNQDSLHKQAQ